MYLCTREVRTVLLVAMRSYTTIELNHSQTCVWAVSVHALRHEVRIAVVVGVGASLTVS
jgi:hypothetical protein